MCVRQCGGFWESELTTLTTTLIRLYLVLRQEEKEQKTVQLVPFELPHNTIKPQEHGAEEGKKRQ